MPNSNFISVRFLKNSDLVWNEFGSVRFKKLWFGSDIVIIYYLFEQLICSKYYSVTVLCWMNCAYNILSSVSCMFISAHCMQVKSFLSHVTWTMDCTQFLSEDHLHRCQIFERLRSLIFVSESNFGFHTSILLGIGLDLFSKSVKVQLFIQLLLSQRSFNSVKLKKRFRTEAVSTLQNRNEDLDAGT